MKLRAFGTMQKWLGAQVYALNGFKRFSSARQLRTHSPCPREILQTLNSTAGENLRCTCKKWLIMRVGKTIAWSLCGVKPSLVHLYGPLPVLTDKGENLPMPFGVGADAVPVGGLAGFLHQQAVRIEPPQ